MEGAIELAEEERKVDMRAVQAARSQIFRRSIPVIAVTGTSGKTTTKEMIASILRRRYGRILKTLGNANKREYTARLLEKLNDSVRGLVIEMGMDGRGQIAAHCRLLPPNIGVITNVSRGHVGKCGGFLGVVKAKNELVYGMRRRGILILNADDEGTALLKLHPFRGRIIWYGKSDKAHYRLLLTEREESGFRFSVMAEGKERQFFLRTLGEHNIYNALAAMSAARALHIPWSEIHSGLTRFTHARGRLSLRRGMRGSQIIDDSFNANPLSMTAGLKALVEAGQGRKTIAVLAAMEEQGRKWRQVHQQVGEEAAQLGVGELVTVGGRARAIAQGALQAGMPADRIHRFRSLSGATAYLGRRLDSNTIVLIKGSHSTEIHHVARALARRRVRR